MLRETNRSVPLAITFTRRATPQAEAPVLFSRSWDSPTEILARPGTSTGCPGVGMSSTWGSPTGGVKTILPTLEVVLAWNPCASCHACDREVTARMLSLPSGESASTTSAVVLRA